jgi:hypothetical protein
VDAAEDEGAIGDEAMDVVTVADANVHARGFRGLLIGGMNLCVAALPPRTNSYLD